MLEAPVGEGVRTRDGTLVGADEILRRFFVAVQHLLGEGSTLDVGCTSHL